MQRAVLEAEKVDSPGVVTGLKWAMLGTRKAPEFRTKAEVVVRWARECWYLKIEKGKESALKGKEVRIVGESIKSCQ